MTPEELIPLYAKRYQQIQRQVMPNGWHYLAVDSASNAVDTWQQLLRHSPKPSPRVLNKLTALWQAGAYVELARFMQFTPTKFSRSLTAQEALSSVKIINDKITATIYTVDDAPIEHVIAYFHGGGLLSGSALRNADWLQYCVSQLGAGWAILNLDYPYITELSLADLISQLSQAVITWISDMKTVDLILAGDSSGGYLATQVAANLHQQAHEINLAGVGLIYPQIMIAPTGNKTAEFMLTFNQLITIQAALIKQAPVAPIFVGPMLVIRAQFDAFNPQINTYLNQQHSALTVVTFNGMQHGFIDYFGYLPQAQLAADELITWVKQVIPG